jgi:hypothetical protein
MTSIALQACHVGVEYASIKEITRRMWYGLVDGLHDFLPAGKREAFFAGCHKPIIRVESRLFGAEMRRSYARGPGCITQSGEKYPYT